MVIAAIMKDFTITAKVLSHVRQSFVFILKFQLKEHYNNFIKVYSGLYMKGFIIIINDRPPLLSSIT